jgi:mannose-6-phosphate isomerase-like protein (cupin superfamily)
MAGVVVRAAEFEWSDHPHFEGVASKVLVGRDTNSAFSTHLVRVEPGYTIETHTHDGTTELFFVIFGTGTCTMDGEERPFLPGSCAYAPAGVPHSVHNSGGAPMELLCMFTPPRA